MAKTLDDLMDTRGISVSELTKRARLSPRALFKLRHGLTANPQSPTVARLARALRVSTDTIRVAIAASAAAKPD